MVMMRRNPLQKVCRLQRNFLHYRMSVWPSYLLALTNDKSYEHVLVPMLIAFVLLNLTDSCQIWTPNIQLTTKFSEKCKIYFWM